MKVRLPPTSSVVRGGVMVATLLVVVPLALVLKLAGWIVERALRQ